MAQHNRVRKRLAILEVALLMGGLLAWAAVPFTLNYLLVPVGWMLFGGSLAVMALRFAHWAIERARAVKDRLGIR